VRHRTYLEHLLLLAMLKVSPDTVNTCRLYWKQKGRTGEPDRSALLDHLYKEFGPDRFLEICEELPLHAPSSPLFFLLYNSKTPGSLISKISHHAPHFHQTRRLELLEEGQDYVVVEDIYFFGDPPISAEDMFIYSTLKGVLHEYGCRGIQVEWESVRSKELYQTLTELGMQPHAIEKFTRWRYRWDRLERSCRIEGMDDFIVEKINASQASTPSHSLLFRLQKILSEDLSHRPPIDEVAAKLDTSVRSLQRKLKYDGTNYAKYYNDLRLNAAEKLLLTTDMTLAEISRFSGFNDSAHLCREFNKKHHTTPNKFRRGQS